MLLKKLFQQTSICIMMSALLLGCKKVSEVKINPVILTDQKIINVYNKLGVIHNRTLDFLYDQLKKIADEKIKAGKSTDAVLLTLQEINQLAETYLKDSLGFSEWDIVPFYCTDTSYRNPEFLYQTTTMIEHYTQVYNDTIAPDLSASVNDLETFFRNDANPLVFQKYDSIIQVKVPEISSQTDKASFVGCASVIKNSYQYWYENHPKWEALIEQLYGASDRSNRIKRKSINEILKDMAWADGSGALVGLIRGAIIGASGGTVIIPGIGTVVGAAAGGLAGGFVGGAVGSGGAAINGFIQWLVNW